MIDLQIIKDYLGITTSEQDEALEALRDRIADVIQKRLDWYFGPPREKVERLDGSGSSLMILRQPPVDPDAVLVERRSGNTWVTVPLTDYEMDGRYLQHLTWIWLSGWRNYRVTYDEGFAAPPGDIAQLLLELMQGLVIVGSSAASATGTVQSETLGDYSYALASESATDAVLLDRSTLWTNIWHTWRRGRV